MKFVSSIQLIVALNHTRITRPNNVYCNLNTPSSSASIHKQRAAHRNFRRCRNGGYLWCSQQIFSYEIYAFILLLFHLWTAESCDRTRGNSIQNPKTSKWSAMKRFDVLASFVMYINRWAICGLAIYLIQTEKTHWINYSIASSQHHQNVRDINDASKRTVSQFCAHRHN